jgi:hypothetical protein
LAVVGNAKRRSKMSVTFSIVGDRRHCADLDCEQCLERDLARTVNLGNQNARDLLTALGLEADEPGMYGVMGARELSQRCAMVTSKMVTPSAAIAPVSEGRVHMGGREEGYVQRRAKDLLALCDQAGQLGRITWG